jgi:outer membrane protein TolC
MRAPLPLALALAALTGCAAGPVATAPDAGGFEAPARWQGLATSDTAALPDWAGLLDPQLAALQARALQANRDIGQAVLRHQAAERLLALAGLDRQPLPSLNASANAQRLLDGGPVSHSYGLTAGVSWEADLWQRLSQLQHAQAADARAAEADIAAARLLVRADVAQRYWALAGLQAERPLIVQQAEIAEQALALTRLRVQEGKLMPIEIDKAAATLQQLRLGLADNRALDQQQRLQLGLLLDQPAPQLPDAARLPGATPPDWRLQPPETALANRPDVQQARARVDAALQRLGAADAARYPSLSFSFSVGTGSSRWQDWLRDPLATLGANLVVPLVDWRRLDLQRDDARGALDSAALQLRDVLHRALVEIEQLAAEQQRLEAATEANTARLSEAAAAERLAEARFEAGAIGRLDWLQARNARLAAEQATWNLRVSAWQNQAALFKAVGG